MGHGWGILLFGVWGEAISHSAIPAPPPGKDSNIPIEFEIIISKGDDFLKIYFLRFPLQKNVSHILCHGDLRSDPIFFLTVRFYRPAIHLPYSNRLELRIIIIM